MVEFGPVVNEVSFHWGYDRLLEEIPGLSKMHRFVENRDGPAPPDMTTGEAFGVCMLDRVAVVAVRTCRKIPQEIISTADKRLYDVCSQSYEMPPRGRLPLRFASQRTRYHWWED